MAIKDISNQLLPVLIFQQNINNSGTVFSSVFDTANYDAGLMIIASKINETGISGHAVRWEESDDVAGPFAEVSNDQKIISRNDNSIVLREDLSQGDTIKKMGLISNERYVRVSLNSGVTSGSSDISVILLASNELIPESDNPQP